MRLCLFICFYLRSVTAAYDCNITLIGGAVIAESRSMCEYMNYHVSMFFFFGASGSMFMLLAVVHAAWYGPNASAEDRSNVRWYAWWALCCLTLMPGFEFVFALFYVCVVTVVFVSIAHACLSSSPFFRRANAVIAVRDTPAVVTVVVTVDQTEPCSICLESGVDNVWFIAPCGHSFHQECVRKWVRGTCPLCRKRMWP
jgi:hypothetical protein